MQSLGIQNFTALNQPLQFQSGLPWQYIRLRNESANECQVNFSGAGGANLGPWAQDDFLMDRGFTGQVTVTPIATVTTTTLQAGYVAGQAWAHGELKSPGPIALSRQVGVTGPVTTSLTSTVMNGNDGFLTNEFIAAYRSPDVGGVHAVSILTTGGATFGSPTQNRGDHFKVNENFDLAGLLSITAGLQGGAGVSVLTNGGDVSVSGSISGTVKLYQPLRGDVKLVIAQVNNFTDAGTKTLALPVPFVFGCIGMNSGSSAFQLLASAVAQTMQCHTGFAGAGDGTVTPVTTMHQNSEWHCDVAFDSISWPSGAVHTGMVFLVGI